MIVVRGVGPLRLARFLGLGVALLACDGGRLDSGPNDGALGDGAVGDGAAGDGSNMSFDGGLWDGARPDGNTTCDRVEVASMPGAAPEVMIVLDKSTSMTNRVSSGSTRTLWQEATDAINGLTTALDADVAFGLAMYPNAPKQGVLTHEQYCTVGGVDRAMALRNGAAIATALSGAFVSGNTPTAATLGVVQTYLRNTARLNSDAKRVVVLVTDGGPNCGNFEGGTRCICTASGSTCDPLQCLDDDASVAAVSALAGDGVEVYIIGFSDQVQTWVSVLDRMATAGGTGLRSHLRAGNTSELEAALSQVATEALPCDYELASVPRDPAYVKVLLDGAQLNPASATPSRGWQLSGNRLELVGSACDDLRDLSRVHALTITVECQIVPLI